MAASPKTVTASASPGKERVANSARDVLKEKPMNLRSLQRFGCGIVAALLAVAAFSSARAASHHHDCELYASVALDSAQQNANLKCGNMGGRWSMDRKFHVDWCMGLQESEFGYMKSETMVRFQALKDCAAKLPEWDEVSCMSHGAGACTYTPDAAGEVRCRNQGTNIMDAVNRVRANPSMFYDEGQDFGLRDTGFYNIYSHWKGFRCRAVNKTGTNWVYLEGDTGALAVGVKPQPKGTPMTSGIKTAPKGDLTKP
jgi:hypothetical protein